MGFESKSVECAVHGPLQCVIDHLVLLDPTTVTVAAPTGAAPATAAHDCALRGTVAEVVYLGTSTNYNVTTSAGAEVVVYSQNSANDASGPQRGEQVWLLWDPANSYAIGSTQ